MGSASKLFYLAFFTLLTAGHGEVFDSRPESHSESACGIDLKATVSDARASFSTFNTLNEQIKPVLHTLTKDTDFFSYYRLNLFNKQCPFWSDENGMCGNIACAVSTLESEDDIPPIWRAETLSRLEGPKAGHPGRKQQQERPKERPLQGMLGEDVGESCVVEYDDECDERDYCVPEDEGATGKGDYVSLVDNPERFTGYAGPGARQVWDAIYRENCFLKPPQESPWQPSTSGLGGLQAVQDFRNVLERHERDQVVTSAARKEGYPLDDDCLEKRVFHRLISGMHASISTHLCWEYFNQSTGKWSPNVECYKERIRNHPERISNLYFNFAVLMRAVAKLQKHLQNYSFCVSDPKLDLETKQKVSRLTDIVTAAPPVFDETIMFQDSTTPVLKEDFRNRFRNVSRVMDCIGCDKCRLWGKLQTAGYGAALKVLFEYDETKNGENPPLRRTELVALINTVGRVSHSLFAVQEFEKALESGTEDQLSDSTPEENAGDVSFDESDGIDVDEGELHEKSKKSEPESLMDTIRGEWNLVWRTYAYVLKSWISIPKTVLDILVLELNRLWSFWLGLPVSGRSWKFLFPSRDEI